MNVLLNNLRLFVYDSKQNYKGHYLINPSSFFKLLIIDFLFPHEIVEVKNPEISISSFS